MKFDTSASEVYALCGNGRLDVEDAADALTVLRGRWQYVALDVFFLIGTLAFLFASMAWESNSWASAAAGATGWQLGTLAIASRDFSNLRKNAAVALGVARTKANP